MSNTLLISGIAVIFVAGALIYVASKRKGKSKVLDISNIKEETTDELLTLADIVGIFKQQNLQQQNDTPFIAKGESIFGMLLKPEEKMHKEGYESLVVGTYREKEETISPLIVIHYKSMDEKLKNVIGNEKLVVLQ